MAQPPDSTEHPMVTARFRSTVQGGNTNEHY
jgi:hypothetical protein